MVYLAIGLNIFILNYLILYWVLLLLHYKSNTKSNLSYEDDFVSVVIPFRNEEKNLTGLIQSLISQNVSKNNFEVIFVNDHSTDSSEEIIIELMSNSGISFQFISVKDTFGKKRALELGFKASKGDLLIQIDADVTFGSSWIKQHQIAHSKKNILLVCGAVDLLSNRSFFQRIQQLEFKALIESTYLTINAKKPVMCNGANLSFKRQILPDVLNSYKTIVSSSGDDVFVLQNINAKYGARTIGYLNSAQGNVISKPQEKFSDFISQRSRWAKKSNEYQNVFAKYFTISIILANLSILTLLIMCCFISFQQTLIFIILPFILKWASDILLLYAYKNTFNSALKFPWFFDSFIIELLYPIYIILVGLHTVFGKQVWKGRIVR